MNANKIMYRLNELDRLMGWYEDRDAYRCEAYAKYSEEYAELSAKLADMGVKRPLF